jgi:hypothetical protein
VRADISSDSFNNWDPAAGTLFIGHGYDLIFPGETILWSLDAGSLSFDDSEVPICAYSDTATPSGPCDPLNPPIIPIATLASEYFGSFSVSGPVFAFGNDIVQIGTWQIHSFQFAIPEPASTSLLCIGLVGLAVSCRRKPNRTKYDTSSAGTTASVASRW